MIKKRLFLKKLKKKRLVPPSIIWAIEEHAKFMIIRLQGAIDMSTVAELETFGEQWILQDGFEPKHILLDFQKVTYTDSAAVAILIQSTVRLKRQNHELGVINIHETLRFMFGFFKVNNIIGLFPSEGAAIKKFDE